MEDGTWTEGRQGHWTTQSSLQHNALAQEVACSAGGSWTVDLSPSKATVRSPERTQTCREAKAFRGHFQDECEDGKGAEECGLAIIFFLASEIVSKLSKFYIKPQSVGLMRIRVPWFKLGVSRLESCLPSLLRSPRLSPTDGPRGVCHVILGTREHVTSHVTKGALPIELRILRWEGYPGLHR